MMYGVQYDDKGVIKHINGSTSLRRAGERFAPKAYREGERLRYNFGIVCKMPKGAEGFGTLEIRKYCRVKSVASNGMVELELGKKV